jgi:hypothetical protein
LLKNIVKLILSTLAFAVSLTWFWVAFIKTVSSWKSVINQNNVTYIDYLNHIWHQQKKRKKLCLTLTEIIIYINAIISLIPWDPFSILVPTISKSTLNE